MPDETYLRYNNFFLNIIGACKIKTDSLIKKFLLRFWRCILSVNTICVILSSYLYCKHENISDFGDIFITCFYIMTCLTVWLKLSYFYALDGTIDDILKEIGGLLKHDTPNKNLQDSADLIKKISCFWMGTCSTFAVGVVLASGIFPLRLGYPYDWKVSPYYELTLTYQVFSFQMLAISFTSTDMFFVSCVLLTNAQFKFLGLELKFLIQSTLLKHGARKVDVRRYFGNPPSSRESTVTEDSTYESIEDLVNSEDIKTDLLQELIRHTKYHQALLKFCVLLEDFFSPIFLPLLLCTAISAVFMAATFTSGVDIAMKFMFGLTFTCMSVSLFWPCYFGQLLLSQTEKFQEDLYDSHWYLCDEKFKANFKILCHGASKPIQLTFGKFANLSLDVFLQVMKAVVSYVIFLGQVAGSSQK